MPRSLTVQILDVLEFAARPLTSVEIWRRLGDDVTKEELASRLFKMRKRKQVVSCEVSASATTGRRKVKAYSLPPEPQPTDSDASAHVSPITREYIPSIAKTPDF